MTTIKKIDPRAFLKLDTLQFNFIQDPGHGWIQVTKDLAQTLGFQNQITSYSYHDQDYYYLEEDGDAGLLFEALKNNKTTWIINDEYTNGDSFVRSLARVGSA
tara:strand:- start:40 stop:348 length:309 start_codon:yes stop_codon:yes gene_type:complete